jgi:putative flippase GtrA
MIKNTKDLLSYLYNHRFVRYLLVGGTTFFIDFGILFSLHAKLNVSLAIATSIAYWTSILYNFLLNREWTFSISERKSLRKHIITYLALLGFNYLFTVIFVSLASRHINYLFAKACAVMIQMSWTYLVYKNVIFIKDDASLV